MKQTVLILAFVCAVAPFTTATDTSTESHEQAARELLQVMALEATFLGATAAMTDSLIEEIFPFNTVPS